MGSSSGYMTRVAQAMEERSARQCAGCPHTMGDHTELPSTWKVENGEPVEVRHPDYEPLLFEQEELTSGR